MTAPTHATDRRTLYPALAEFLGPRPVAISPDNARSGARRDAPTFARYDGVHGAWRSLA